MSYWNIISTSPIHDLVCLFVERSIICPFLLSLRPLVSFFFFYAPSSISSNSTFSLLFLCFHLFFLHVSFFPCPPRLFRMSPHYVFLVISCIPPTISLPSFFSPSSLYPIFLPLLLSFFILPDAPIPFPPRTAHRHFEKIKTFFQFKVRFGPSLKLAH